MSLRRFSLAESIAALVSGLFFGGGLVWSEMVNPARVLAFLDLADQWSPGMAIVMAAALLVSVPGYFLILRRAHPLLGGSFHFAEYTGIDKHLMAGSVLFGIGWGLVGFCPGPALMAMVSGQPGPFIFIAGMAAGILAYDKGPLAHH